MRPGAVIASATRNVPPEGPGASSLKEEASCPSPLLPLEQREQALKKAAEARSLRSAALNEIRAGNLSAAEVLTNPGPLQRAKVRQVLLAVPGIGAVRADRLLAEARIDPGRRVSGLGANQRKALTDALAA